MNQYGWCDSNLLLWFFIGSVHSIHPFQLFFLCFCCVFLMRLQCFDLPCASNDDELIFLVGGRASCRYAIHNMFQRLRFFYTWLQAAVPWQIDEFVQFWRENQWYENKWYEYLNIQYLSLLMKRMFLATILPLSHSVIPRSLGPWPLWALSQKTWVFVQICCSCNTQLLWQLVLHHPRKLRNKHCPSVSPGFGALPASKGPAKSHKTSKTHAEQRWRHPNSDGRK